MRPTTNLSRALARRTARAWNVAAAVALTVLAVCIAWSVWGIAL